MRMMPIALLSFLLMVGCDSDDGSSSSSGPRTCGAASVSGDAQPDRARIENLFGCVTLTYTPESGETPVARSVVFSASSERDPILGGRTVGATAGFTNYLCTEVSFGEIDFLCVSSFLSNLGRYELSMDSQFEGSGIYQLCLGSLDNCSLDGAEFPIQAATIDIARGAILTKSVDAMGKHSTQVDVRESVETKISALEKKLVFQELLSVLDHDQHLAR